MVMVALVGAGAAVGAGGGTTGAVGGVTVAEPAIADAVTGEAGGAGSTGGGLRSATVAPAPMATMATIPAPASHAMLDFFGVAAVAVAAGVTGAAVCGERLRCVDPLLVVPEGRSFTPEGSLPQP